MNLRPTVCLMSLMLVSGCAPMFSYARMLPPGHIEVTPSVSPSFVSGGGETAHAWNDFGVRVQAGLSDRVGWGAGYNRTVLTVDDAANGFGFNTVAFGPKVSLMPERLAVAVPVTFSFGEGTDSDHWLVNPTLLMTLPVNERVDFNPAVRLLVPICDDCKTAIAFHAGFGLRAGRRLILRPEAAMVVTPGEDAVTWTLGLGTSLR